MNGIFSGAPCPSSIRLLVGTHLLMILQSSLVLWSAPDLGGSQALIWLTLFLGVTAFICAVCGESRTPAVPWRERRRGR
ncbi:MULTISPECIES: hypothetical protein [Sphingomonadaceae]|jgi:hypothetical protein|uniref:Uncharacterized protein n=3 Tax=Sphingomonadaceae TaxID=41297 RepID=F6ESU8_SPHCR|nr:MULTISPECIES: hypothetical protein [Sphingomonadaceae]ARR57648.1 hypothetical protein HY78_29370 [Rhizorhabdus wittichii DC-6]AEG48564.1 hypothetical protein Sphch_0871 [Sphingobium chlorophenolicum L-1]AMK18031.1 hypothetical protein K663_08250 [Sphingobium sp. MI1205]KEQ55659.1 putative uncharacterized protein precursor [Sphingobium chlorophenolicum]RIA46122.1 hypothetical protein DFR49_0655 [Hephaestia caeni]